MPKVNIKKEDQVYVLSGRDRGKKGRVLMVFPDKGRALVENINIVKRHTKANPQKNIKGGVVSKEASINLSSVMIICRECGERTRVQNQRDAQGRKQRHCKKCKGLLDKS